MIANRCRVELGRSDIVGTNEQGGRHGYVDMIAGEISHKDNWRVVVQSSLCDAKTPGDQVNVVIAPNDFDSKTTPSSKGKSIKSESRARVKKALDLILPKTRDNGLTIRGGIRAARACKSPDLPSRRLVRSGPPPSYIRHSCWGSLKNASFPSPIEAGIHYLNNLGGRPGIDAGKCDQVSCSWDTAISWCSTVRSFNPGAFCSGRICM